MPTIEQVAYQGAWFSRQCYSRSVTDIRSRVPSLTVPCSRDDVTVDILRSDRVKVDYCQRYFVLTKKQPYFTAVPNIYPDYLD